MPEETPTDETVVTDEPTPTERPVDPVKAEITATRSRVDDLRAQIAAAKKDQAQKIVATDDGIALVRLAQEEARLIEELAAVQAGAAGPTFVPDEAVSESALPEGVPTEPVAEPVAETPVVPLAEAPAEPPADDTPFASPGETPTPSTTGTRRFGRTDS